MPCVEPIGRRSVMRNQLRKLADVAPEPHVTVQILPLDANGEARLEGSPTPPGSLVPTRPHVRHPVRRESSRVWSSSRPRADTCAYSALGCSTNSH
ncbi:MAG: Scr1 family TA system antitoxin-like transcriptional regulator [Pseudonocardia sp.]